MDVVFDPEKDAANVAKHGVSLARAADLQHVIAVPDDVRGASPAPLRPARRTGALCGGDAARRWRCRPHHQPTQSACERVSSPCLIRPSYSMMTIPSGLTRTTRALGRSPSTPDIAAALRVRGLQKAPTKRLVSLRLDPDVLDHFRSTGRGWQGRLNETLRRAAGL